MKKLKTFLLALALVFGLTLALPATGFAWDPFGGIDCDANAEVKKTAVCADKVQNGINPLTGGDGVILRIANLIALVAGVAAVIMIVLAGLRFVTSGGSSEDIAGARRSLIYAAVGLVVIIVARVLVGFVVSKI